MCDNLINALKLLAKQRKDGDSPVRMIVPGLLEKSRRKVTDELRSFIAVDNRAAVKNWSSGERNEVEEGGKAKVHDRLPAEPKES